MRVEPHSASLKEEPGFPPNLAARPFFFVDIHTLSHCLGYSISPCVRW